ncbi:RNA-binding cell elongation regulator Jag/EloR [Paenibacillus assamensis]|uniref:RNA-binding cell elongation regulator Jag/EloR n=1 Tax=Paenibacillus assamensis TaxID=311244 RepID=UPI0003FECBC1|nr:RNA-binding cell elongation regulator Jag/EloR [Paenibacillus assamensis]
MKTLIVSGKTIEHAIQKGLAELGVTQDRVQVRILEQPSKGFFGLIGTKPAKVELTVEEAAQTEDKPLAAKGQSEEGKASTSSAVQAVPEEQALSDSAQSEEKTVRASVQDQTAGVEEAKQFILDVTQSMGLEVEIAIVKRKDTVVFDISGSDLGLIIGRRGQTLDSLQYLANLVANRYSEQHVRLVLDAEQFRDRRKQTLESLAERLATKTVRTHKEMILEPMTPQERKIIHAKLQDHPKVKTYSKGEEPNRRIVIALKSQ